MSVLRPQDVVRKPAIVVVTHEHEDHYSAAFRQWADSLRDEIFAAGGTVPLRAGDVRLDPRAIVRLGPAQVWTIRSTDEGVGVLVRIGDVTVFHAGDHARWNAATDSAYRAEIDYLNGLGLPIDIALLPIATGSPCEATPSIQEGALYAIATLRPHVTLPMHVRCGARMASIYGDFAQIAGRTGATVVAPLRIGEEFFYERPRLVRGQR
jgi:L-ascorbate metabolism protein UlaG (beta-lactamase superfamily)